MRLLGIFLIVSGILLLIYGGVTFFIPREVIDLGVFSITVRENVVIPLPPILGLVCLISGLAIIASGPVAAPPPPI